MKTDKVEIQTNEYTNPDGSVRAVDQIVLWVAGYRFLRDVTDEQRDRAMAMRIAEEAGCLFDDARDEGLRVFTYDKKGVDH